MEGSATLPAYGTVKGALRGFAKSLALEEGPHGVNITCVSPLAVTPAMFNAYESNPDLEGALKKLVPLGRVGDPLLDIAPVITFLLGEGARYIMARRSSSTAEGTPVYELASRDRPACPRLGVAAALSALARRAQSSSRRCVPRRRSDASPALTG